MTCFKFPSLYDYEFLVMEFHKKEVARRWKRKHRVVEEEYRTDYKKVMALIQTYGNEAKNIYEVCFTDYIINW